MSIENASAVPWNKGKLVGQKLPLKLKEIWAIRVRLQLSQNLRDLALFNLTLDSKLRGSDLVKIRVSDISNSGVVGAVRRYRQTYSKPGGGGVTIQHSTAVSWPRQRARTSLKT